MATSTYISDVFVRHQVYLEGLKTQTVGEFDPLFQELEKALVGALAGAGVTRVNELTPAQLETLVQEINRVERELFGTFATDLTSKLEGVAEYEADFAEQALREALGDVPINPLSPGTAWLYAKTHPIQATGQLLESFIDGWTARDIAAAEAILRNAHAQGWTIQETIVAIRGHSNLGFKDGLIAKIRRDIESLVRTSIQYVSNAARIAAFSANSDIVIGYRWVSVLDGRTTPMCRSLDGKVFEIGQGPLPPLHVNCRSTTIPEMAETAKILESLKRASASGPVSASTTYYEWLKNQPATFQDSVLGKTRGKLLRSGGLTADEFARLNLGRTFRPRTLDEMRSLRPEVFNRAGL